MLGNPNYYVLVNNHVKYKLSNNEKATYEVNKLLINGIDLSNIDIIVGYEVPLNVGDGGCKTC